MGALGGFERDALVDGCAFPDWPETTSLADYLESGWRDTILRPGDRGGELSARSSWLYRTPLDEDGSTGHPVSAAAGGLSPEDRFALFVNDFFGTGEGARRRLVLGYDEGLLAMAIENYHLARALAQAANLWMMEHWLAEHDGCYGLVLICSAVPEDAAADIRRFGAEEGMVGVALGANGLGRPFGHSAYRPIFEAAAELDLPIVIQTGADAISALDSRPTASGLPTTYGEYAALAPQPLMGHIGSIISQGLFVEFPNLRVLLMGGGACWVSAYLWRLDYWYKLNGREAPWLDRAPSAYFRDHVAVGTHSLEDPHAPERVKDALAVDSSMENMLLYTSCFPHPDAEACNSIAARVPAEWHRRVFVENAKGFYRWPSSVPAVRRHIQIDSIEGGDGGPI